MFSLDGEIKGADLKLKLPNAADWYKLGSEEAKEIRTRTETRGKDVNNKDFEGYSEYYKKWLKKNRPKKNPLKPNLSLSAKMMSALGSNIQAKKDQVKITLSGNEGYKAWDNERKGREFLGVPDDRLEKLAERIGQLIFKRL